MKKAYISVGCVIVILLLSISLVRRNAICYIGYTTDLSDSLQLYVKLDIDGENLYEGTVPSTFIHDMQRKVNLNLGLGFHTIRALIVNENREQTISFFYFLQKYVIIDFSTWEERKEGDDIFWIRLCNEFPIM